MTHSVLTKVSNSKYNGQKFYLYKHGAEKLTVLTLEEANKLAEILNRYPNVFSETEVVPRSEEEIKLLETFWGEDGRDLDFSIEEVADDCPNIIDRLEENFDTRISGIDRQETVRQTFKNE
jgi:hypothetical protein